MAFYVHPACALKEEYDECNLLTQDVNDSSERDVQLARWLVRNFQPVSASPNNEISAEPWASPLQNTIVSFAQHNVTQRV